MDNSLTRFLERIGVLQPRYVEGWPRGVRRMVPSAPYIQGHIAEKDPALWAEIGSMLPLTALYRAQEAGLITGVGPDAILSDVRIA